MINDGIDLKENDVLSFLMIGQSNMAGRGNLCEVEPIKNDKCYMLRMGRWQRMAEPINPDRDTTPGEFHSGVSLGASFADEAARHFGCKVGMIPCADGGTVISSWQPGQLLYDHARLMTQLAMRTSRLSGILWHQGESDCHYEESVRAHKGKLVKMIETLRADLGMPNLPVIIGDISTKIDEHWRVSEFAPIMNAQHREIAREIPACAVVSVDDLSLKSDGIHFDSQSLRVLGKRYFETYITLTQNR